MIVERIGTDTLVRLGLVGLALQGVLRMMLDRAGRTTDATDFALGVLLAVSASVLLLTAGRRGRQRRAQP
jgi:hypothetical protein